MGYYSTVRIFGGTTSRKRTVDANPSLPTLISQNKKITIRVGFCLEESVGEEGGPEELVLCNFRVVRRVESLWGDLFMSFFFFFYKNPL